MVMPSPGVMMPTIRSPGTAPPFGAKRTGRSELMPRIGIAPSFSWTFGTLNFIALPIFRPNQPPSDFGGGTAAMRSSL